MMHSFCYYCDSNCNSFIITNIIVSMAYGDGKCRLKKVRVCFRSLLYACRVGDVEKVVYILGSYIFLFFLALCTFVITYTYYWWFTAEIAHCKSEFSAVKSSADVIILKSIYDIILKLLRLLRQFSGQNYINCIDTG